LEGQKQKDEYPLKGRGPEKYFLYEIISNKLTGVDVDKWDYFLRDSASLKIGITFDVGRFMKNMTLADWPFFADNPGKLTVKRIAIRDKCMDNCMEMFLDRSRLHRKGYQHRVVKIFDVMLVDAWTAADNFFPLTGSEGKTYSLSEAVKDVECLQKPTDDWVNQAIKNSDDPALAPARQILRRIDDRDKYKIIAQIESDKSIEGSERSYEESLRDAAGLIDPSEADLDNPDILKANDLCIFKKIINMGKKDKSNPVLGMLFTDKLGNVEVKTEEDLQEIAPSKLFEEQLFVLCRRNGKTLENKAKNAVEVWVHGFPSWKVKYHV